mmetsp:Transcript_22715/g.49612  ORF Transcript_22715/g.49612 Transcript_22715/m.49612 type:complete len:206 (-) Transcript_22715:63-680(-)
MTMWPIKRPAWAFDRATPRNCCWRRFDNFPCANCRGKKQRRRRPRRLPTAAVPNPQPQKRRRHRTPEPTRPSKSKLSRQIRKKTPVQMTKILLLPPPNHRITTTTTTTKRQPFAAPPTACKSPSAMAARFPSNNIIIVVGPKRSTNVPSWWGSEINCAPRNWTCKSRRNKLSFEPKTTRPKYFCKAPSPNPLFPTNPRGPWRAAW